MNLALDSKYAIRMLLKYRGVTAVAVLTLALGIGANTAVFSVLKAVVLAPFPYPEADRIVAVWESPRNVRTNMPFSAPDYWDLKAETTCFEKLGVYVPRIFNVSDREPVPVQGIAATAGVLQALGVPPSAGRLFTEEEEQEGNQRVVVLSDKLWKRLWDGDPNVLGRTIRVNGENHEVIGILPKEFDFYTPWYQGMDYEIWTPLVLPKESNRISQWLLAVGRLKPGVSRLAAEEEMRGVTALLAERFPQSRYDIQMWLQPYSLDILGGFIERLIILLGTVGLLLLMACANVASILLAKGSLRQSEVAVRVALGASRKDIIAQFLTESLVLSVVGGVAGVLLALWGIDSLRQLLPLTMPRTASIGIDRDVLLFTMVLCFITAILSGLAPARAAFRTNVVDALKEGGGSRSGTRHRNLLFRRIVVVQVALALLITNGALMLFASYRKLLQTDLIFDTDRVLTLELWLTGPRYQEGAQRVRFWEQLQESVAQIPGVGQAEVTTKLPLEGGRNGEILTDDQVFTPNTPRPLAEWSYVSPGYFDAMGIPLLAGRTLRKEDFNPKEIGVVVNTALADRCWPGGNPLGKRIRQNSAQLLWQATVVGVVESVRQMGAERRPRPEIFFPYEVEPRTKSFLIVRSSGEPLQFVSAIRKEISGIDSDLAPTRVRTMATVFSTVTRHRRFLTLLLDLFAGIALVLAISGVYGTISHQVAQRTHEFGVRIALGATKGRVLGTVLRETASMLLLGGGIGLIATIQAAFVLRNQFYGITPWHPLYLGSGIFLVAAAALVASLVPALRASRIDPVQALRAE